MSEHRRKADGRRVLSTDFNRATVQRMVTGEKTVAELVGNSTSHPLAFAGRRVSRGRGRGSRSEIANVAVERGMSSLIDWRRITKCVPKLCATQAHS
jgi:hypothetical protein